MPNYLIFLGPGLLHGRNHVHFHPHSPIVIFSPGGRVGDLCYGRYDGNRRARCTSREATGKSSPKETRVPCQN